MLTAGPDGEPVLGQGSAPGAPQALPVPLPPPVLEALPPRATLAALGLHRGLSLKFMGSLPEFTPEHGKDTSGQGVGLGFRATPHKPS